MKLSTMGGRIARAVLAGLVVFVVLLVIGMIVERFDVEIGETVQRYAAVLGLIAGLVQFFTGDSPVV